MSPNAAEGKERMGLKDLGQLIQQTAQNSPNKPQESEKPQIILPEAGNQAIEKPKKSNFGPKSHQKRPFNKNRINSKDSAKKPQNRPAGASQSNPDAEISIQH